MKNIQLIVCPSFVGGTPDGDPEGVRRFADQLLLRLLSSGKHATSIDIALGVGAEYPLLPTNCQEENIANAGFLAHVVSNLVKHVISCGDLPVVIGGDHSVAIGSVSGALSVYGDELGLAWFDQHPDMHTFESSVSKRAHGMGLRVLLGEGHRELLNVAKRRISPRRVIHIGATDIEPGEDAAIDYFSHLGALFVPHPLRDVDHEELDLRLTQFEIADTPLHLELDVDVTDLLGVPISCRNTRGISVESLGNLISSKFRRLRVVSVGISEYVGKNDRDQTSDKIISLIDRLLL